MALIRVAQYNSTPTIVGDYQAQNAHLQAFTNQLLTQQFILDAGTTQPVIKQGTYVSHGGSLYVADADTSITGSPSDGSVYIRVSGTTSLTVEFINNISGYTWNPVYSALTSTTYTLLPYLIVKASTVWTRYNFNPNNQSFGAIKATSIDTGSGAMTFDQAVNTDSDVEFNGLMLGSSGISLQYPNMSAGDVSQFSFSDALSSTASKTYVSVGSFSIRSKILKMASEKSGISSARVVFMKTGGTGGASSQLRVMKNGVQEYESGMTTSETLTFDISLNATDILDFQIRVTAGIWNPGSGYIKFSRNLTNLELHYESVLGYDE